MSGRIAWLEREAADVPAGDEWLAPDERAVQETFTVAKRRADWRLGRWTAKQALAAWFGDRSLGEHGGSQVSIVAAADGAPEVHRDGHPLALRLSISHRAGRGACAIGPEDVAVGCDLELVEPRSEAFLREWLAPPEQALVADASSTERPLIANLIWSAKEAVAKAHREGLRLEVRGLVVEPAVNDEIDGWRRVRITDDERRFEGWWRTDGAFVLVIVANPPAGVPPSGLVASTR